MGVNRENTINRSNNRNHNNYVGLSLPEGREWIAFQFCDAPASFSQHCSWGGFSFDRGKKVKGDLVQVR